MLTIYVSSVAYVSRSGGMSNELNNIISRTTDGVYEGVAIGGDRYPGTTFMDHIMRYQADPDIKMIVLLGEVGGVEEYEVCEALKQKKITKPLVAWCIGTCASKYTYSKHIVKFLINNIFFRYVYIRGSIWSCWFMCQL